ncbi:MULTISPECIES: pheA operon leader peptide PheL [Mangrovibacter]|nr:MULTISPECIES: pheA operon leader peptide PheL [Mangrovibacter]
MKQRLFFFAFFFIFPISGGRFVI